MAITSPAAARRQSRAGWARPLQCALLTLALASVLPAQAAGTSKATDAAPRADEIEWIDFSDFAYGPAASPAGQPFTIDLLDGRTLRFTLKFRSNLSDAEANSGPDFSPIGFPRASFGRTGYMDVAGQPILHGYHTDQDVAYEFTNIHVSDALGNRYAFEWIAADAESTGSSAPGPLPERNEYIAFETNGQPWTEVAELDRFDDPNDPFDPGIHSPNPNLQLELNGNQARIFNDPPTRPEGGSYVVASSNPATIQFTFGNTLKDPDRASRQAAAFGIVAGTQRLAVAPVPANHPLALLLAALALGGLGFTALRRRA